MLQNSAHLLRFLPISAHSANVYLVKKNKSQVASFYVNRGGSATKVFKDDLLEFVSYFEEDTLWFYFPDSNSPAVSWQHSFWIQNQYVTAMLKMIFGNPTHLIALRSG